MDARPRSAGFTLVEVLIALTILSIVMTILHGTFSSSATTARVVDDRTDELSSLTGALDTIGHEVRTAYGSFSGAKRRITFTTMTPFQQDTMPVVQTVSYEFDQGQLLRKMPRPGQDPGELRTFLLLEQVTDPSFAFFDGAQWREDWPFIEKLPAGVRVTFSYRGKPIDTVITVWSRK